MGKIKKKCHDSRGNHVSLVFKGDTNVATQVGVWLEHLGYSVNTINGEGDFRILTSTEDARILKENPDVLVSFDNVNSDLKKHIEENGVVINVNHSLSASQKFEIILDSLGNFLHL